MAFEIKKRFRFWHEVNRRKVLPFLIGYIAACFAIIEFLDISSSRFTISENTFDLLYMLGAVGLPIVIILPWFINRKSGDSNEESVLSLGTKKNEEKKVMHNLPAQLTTFIGRKKETRILSELISEHRIITITGSGGCGKTRLACEVAEEIIRNFKDGVWFVDLAPIIMEDLVAKEITEVLNIPEEPGRTITDTLIHRIKDKNLLIILDNCEHLIRATSEVSAKLTQSAPGLQIIATSREPLNIRGEKVWRIPSLTLLDPKTIIDVESANNSEAVLLFTARARLNNPDFELATENVQEVVSICNKLDGIPLALELVASRTRHMNPQLMLERLSGGFELISSSDILTSERQKTLHATIEWSYNLLSENEKLLFTRLPVFMGGFELQAVEKVCADEQLPRELILDLLSGLVDKSMLHIVNRPDQSMSYNFYETLRQFAMQHLQFQNKEDYMRERHLKHFLELAETANKERMVSQSKWLKTLELQHDNLIAALQWSESHSPEYLIRLSGFLAWFWTWHTHFLTGRYYLDKSKLKGGVQTEAYARVLAGSGIISLFSGAGSNAIDLMKEGLDIWRQFNNKEEEALILSEISHSYYLTGDNDSGLRYGKEGLEVAVKAGIPGTINFCMSAVCQGYVSLKQVDQARSLAQQLLDSSQELDLPLNIRIAHHYLADCALMDRKYQEAEKEYGTAAVVAYKFGNMLMVCIEILGVAFSVSGQSRLPKAIRLSSASRNYALENGLLVPEYLQYGFWVDFVNDYIVSARNELGEELTQKYEEEGNLMGFEKALEYALDSDKD